jgi:fructose/tagatose bisphosphate aldolase
LLKFRDSILESASLDTRLSQPTVSLIALRLEQQRRLEPIRRVGGFLQIDVDLAEQQSSLELSCSFRLSSSASRAPGGPSLVALCLAAARLARVSVGVHLDHSTSIEQIQASLDLGVPSVMADGSHLAYSENAAFCGEVVVRARRANAVVEVELERLSGTEDGLTVPERNARLTDPAQAVRFIRETGSDSLAVCIGNVHGHYRGEPVLDMERLDEIRHMVESHWC